MADRELTELIDSARLRNQEAIELLFKRCEPHVFSICLSFFNEWGFSNSELYKDAQDASQESLIKIFKSLDNLNSSKAFGSWIKTIVYRECKAIKTKKEKRLDKVVDCFKKVKVEFGRIVPKVEFGKIEKNYNSNDLSFEKLEYLFLQRKMDTLDDTYKEIIRYRFFLRMTFKEISEVLDLPQTTVRDRVSKAIKELGLGLSRKRWGRDG